MTFRAWLILGAILPTSACSAILEPWANDSCIESVDPMSQASLEAHLAQFEGVATPAVPLPAFTFDPDELGGEGDVYTYQARCQRPESYSFFAPISATDSRGVPGLGYLRPHLVEVNVWAPSPEDEAWIRGESEAVMGPLGALVEMTLFFWWPGPELQIAAHYDDPTVEGGRRQVDRVAVPSFQSTYEFAVD